VAIARRGTPTSASGGHNTGPLSVTKPTGVVDGDIVYLRTLGTTGNNGTPALVTPTGFTKVTGASGSLTIGSDVMGAELFWKRASGEGASYSISWDRSCWHQAVCFAYSGALSSGDPNGPSSYQADTVSDTSKLAPGVTVADADSMLVFMGSNWGNNIAATPPTGMSERVETINLYLADLLVAAGATGDKTMTLTSGADHGTGALVVLKPDAGSPPAISGSGGVSFGAPTLSGAAAETFTGSGGAAFGAPALAGTGELAFSAAGAAAFGAPALAGAGTETFTGSGGAAFGAPVLSASGTSLLAITGDGTVTFGVPTLAGSGATGDVFTGSGGVAFGAPALSGAGAQTFDAQGATTFAVPTLSGTGVQTFAGTAAVAFGAPVLTGAASLGFSGLGAVLWQAPVLAATGAISDPSDVPAREQAIPARSTTALAETRDVLAIPPGRTSTITMEAL
jgi:hypothetical protein